MERLRNRKPAGIGKETLRTWGLVFLGAGIIGRGVIQAHMLGISGMNTAQMLETISSMENGMTLASVSLVLQAAELCAVPIFALLLVEGAQHTKDWKAYLLRLLGLALVSEIPYNLAMGGRFLDMGSRNPVFSLVLGLAMLQFYRYYQEKGLKNTAVKLVVTVAAVLWCRMLQVDGGAPMILIIATLWLMRDRGMYRSYVGSAVAVLCTAFSPFYLATPMGFLVVHMYNGEVGEDKGRKYYWYYPAMLVLAVLAGWTL